MSKPIVKSLSCIVTSTYGPVPFSRNLSFVTMRRVSGSVNHRPWTSNARYAMDIR